MLFSSFHMNVLQTNWGGVETALYTKTEIRNSVHMAFVVLRLSI